MRPNQKQTQKKFLFYIIISAISLITVSILQAFTLPTEINSETTEHTISTTQIEQPIIPHEIYFCGQRVPLEYFDVQESLDRELVINSYWHSNTTFLLKRAYRYFPTIDSILIKNNIPIDMKYIAVIESALSNVTSPANAKGYWQFMDITAKEFGLEVSNEVDERLDIEKSTLAACKYLKLAYKEFNDWFLVAASYNMGISGITKSLHEQQVDNYFDLRLNTETSRYVYRIIAIKCIMENPAAYHYNIDTTYLYKPLTYSTVNVDTCISDLTIFARRNNTTIKMLKMLNPWLTSDALQNEQKKNYSIKMPNNETRTQTFGN